MNGTTFLLNALAAAVIGIGAAWLHGTLANDNTTGHAAGRTSRPSTRRVTPLAQRLAADAERIRTSSHRPARATVLAAFVPAVNRARLTPTRRLARRERRLRRSYARTILRADQLIDLAAARLVLVERGRALAPLDKALPRLTAGADR